MLACRRFLQKSSITKLNSTTRCLSSTTTDKAPVVPRITERRLTETGPGGRGSDAGLKVCVFGASGMLGRYVCSHLGKFYCWQLNQFIHCASKSKEIMMV